MNIKVVYCDQIGLKNIEFFEVDVRNIEQTNKVGEWLFAESKKL